MKSFRNRIRYAAVGLIAGVLIIFNAFVYWGFNTLAQRYMDARLYGLGHTLAELFEQQPELLLASEREIATRQEGRTAGAKDLRQLLHSVQVVSFDGTVVWRGIDVLQSTPAPASVLEQVQHRTFVYETLSTPGTAVRRIFVPIQQDGVARFVLQAESSLGFFQKTRRGLILLLISGSAAMVGVAWLGSAWVARQVLVPVQVLNRTAENISASSLRDRMALNVPYEEFQQVAQAFNAMLERLRKAYQSQRRFVDDAAHEIQTPLTVIQSTLEWAVKRPRTPEEYAEGLSTSLKHLARLIALSKSLLVLARFGAESPPVHLTPLGLTPLVRGVVDDLRLLAEDRSICLRLDIQPVAPVLGDQERLKQVIINLLDNGLRYTNPGGTVTVSLRDAGDHSVLVVRDTGPGIEPEALPHIFERFYRSPQIRKDHPEGVGLGLALVKEIAEAHRGSVAVESHIGQGTTITVSLPRIRSALHSPADLPPALNHG